KRSWSRNASPLTGRTPTPPAPRSERLPPAGQPNSMEPPVRAPDEIAAALRHRFDRDFPAWARGGGTWPMRLSLSPPTMLQRTTDPSACHTWADHWRAYPGPGRVETGILRFPTGSHDMPKRIVFDTPHQVAASSSDTHARWQTCASRLTEL